MPFGKTQAINSELADLASLRAGAKLRSKAACLAIRSPSDESYRLHKQLDMLIFGWTHVMVPSFQKDRAQTDIAAP